MSRPLRRCGGVARGRWHIGCDGGGVGCGCGNSSSDTQTGKLTRIAVSMSLNDALSDSAANVHVVPTGR